MKLIQVKMFVFKLDEVSLESHVLARDERSKLVTLNTHHHTTTILLNQSSLGFEREREGKKKRKRERCEGRRSSIFGVGCLLTIYPMMISPCSPSSQLFILSYFFPVPLFPSFPSFLFPPPFFNKQRNSTFYNEK